MSRSKDQNSEDRPDGSKHELYELEWFQALKANIPVTDEDRVHQKLKEIVSLLWAPKSLPPKEQQMAVVRAIELMEDLAPSDGAESMLALQMVGTHLAAIECLRRAMIPDQLTPSRDINLRAAHKMMTLFAKQMEALNKHRGKGQQKVTVEYVNVESGAQAIVGSVEAGRPNPGKKRKRAPRLEKIVVSNLDLAAVAHYAESWAKSTPDEK